MYVNPTFTARVVELSRKESDALLRFLFEHLLRPEFQVRLKWRVNDVAIWDNRATQHYATGDYYPHYRRMHRVTVGGDKPRGVNQSEPREAIRGGALVWCPVMMFHNWRRDRVARQGAKSVV